MKPPLAHDNYAVNNTSANEGLVAAVKNLGTAGDAGEDRLDGFAGRQLPKVPRCRSGGVVMGSSVAESGGSGAIDRST
jgi:hypothetical protein